MFRCPFLESGSESNMDNSNLYSFYVTDITGIAAIYNAVEGRYPFVESILSVLPICQEMLISDGGSTDGTLEILQKLESRYSKIKVLREKWQIHENGKRFRGLVKTVNRLMRRVKTSHILYLQVDEVYHEDCLSQIAGLPKIYPTKMFFKFPFIHLYSIRPGRENVFERPFYSVSALAPYPWAVRMIRNRPQEITSFGDAWTFCFKFKEVIKKYLFHPKKLGKTIFLGDEVDGYTAYVYLKYPVFHFRGGRVGIDVDRSDLKPYRGPFPAIVRNLIGEKYTIRRELLE
jgi:glycosyltransferase involved in cell wall biosynthesis